MAKILKRILKILGWTIGSILLLLVLIIILIQVPGVQNFARKKAVTFLQSKLGTKVEVRHLSIAFPKKIVLEGVYFEDQKKDTLLAGNRLAVDISMFKLLDKVVEVNDIELEGIRANIYRIQPDTVFNFDYIVQAFSSPPSNKPKDTTGAFTIDINHVKLSKILATFKDDQTGNDVYCYLGEFETKIKKFDLDKMNFNVPKLRLEHVIARAYQHKPLVEPKPAAEIKENNTGAIDLGLEIGNITIRDIDADYGNDVSAIAARIKLGELITEPRKIDLRTLNIALKQLTLNNTNAMIALGNTPAAHVVEEQTNQSAKAQAENPWKIELEKVSFANNDIKFDNNQRKKEPRGMDYAHLDVKGLTIDAKNMSFTPTQYAGDINHIAFTEQSGFVLKKLKTNFLYNDNGASLDNLLLETDKTIIRDEIRVGWKSLANLPNQMGEMLIKAELKDTRVAFEDVLTFVPTLASAPPFKGNERAILKLNTSIKGYLKDLEIPNLEVSGFQGTALKMSGRIKGLPDGAKANYNVNIANLATTQADLNKLLPPGTLPPSVRIPERLGLRGIFTGSMDAFNTRLALTSSRGTVGVEGVMRGMGKSYNMTVGTNSLDLGYILKQEKSLGRVTLTATAAGSGFDPEKMVANVKASVVSAEAQGYTYRNLGLVAKMNKGNIDAVARMRDPNLNFDLNANALMKGKFPAVKADLQLDSANLQAMKLYKDELKLHGRIIADLSSTDPDALDGSVRISDLIVANNGKRYAIFDTVSIDAYAAEAGGRTIAVKSPAVNLDLTGQYKLTEIAPAVQATINKYYALPGYKPAPFSPQTWTLSASVVPSPLLYSFVPDMKGSDSINALVSFNSSANDLQLNANAKKIVFGTNRADSLTIRANTGADALAYSLNLNSATASSLKLFHTSLNGNVANNQLTTALDVKDVDNKSRYQLAAILNQVPNDGFKVSLQQGLMLNYDTWNVAGDNYIQYDNAGLVINNFNIGNGGQSIRANSTTLNPSAPIDVQFSNFRINTITTLLKQDSLLADGLINGGAQLRNPTRDLTFTSDLTIADLSYMQDTVGTLTVKVNNETAQTLAADVQILGFGNDIKLNGRYMIPSKSMDLNLNLANINLNSIKKFTAGQLSDASGNLRGNVAIKGTIEQPQVNGNLNFNQAYITPTLLGERFSLTDESISINNTGIHFNSFDIADSTNNKATINGDILTSDFKDYKFALTVKADNFQAMKSVRKPGSDQPFYGKLNITTNTRISGALTLPVISSAIRINRGTDFSYILPTDNPEVQSREGVVEFFDPRHPDDSSVFAALLDTMKNQSAMKGIDFDASLETDSAARFNIVIDDLNNDALHIKGMASLQAGMDRSGKVSLTGAFQLTEGSYLLTLSFLKRQFFVQPGSTITWNGDPMSATVDITAMYTTKTAPIDLMEHQLSGRSQSEINQYKQRLPFTVYLRMKNELLKPDVSFDIGLPERELAKWKDVDLKLQQIRNDESELNKQVFALLLLNRFIDENPLEGNGSSTGEAMVRQSASRILTDQLNKLAGGLVPGVDLNFGVNSGDDYSTGQLQQRTDLTVGISKRLLNDRLTVTVGSSFQVEGAQNSNQQASNIGGDISLDYQLSKDGRYRLRAYRRNDYEGIAVGQVIETGAGVIFTIDYDKFSEFFRKNKKTTPAKN